MRFLRFERAGREGLATIHGDEVHGVLEGDGAFPGKLSDLLGRGPDGLKKAADQLANGELLDLDAIEYLPPVEPSNKILCIGINYMQHIKETHAEVPKFPTIFSRFQSSIVGHRGKIIRPRVSVQFDYEGELVAVIGKRCRYVPESKALEYVVGYSIFNDGTIRDIQFRTTQWDLGKNFDASGAFGPYIVTADELPAGATGLLLQTRLNGEVLQKGRTDDLLFNVAAIVSYISQGITLEPGDIIVTGTPAGVGWGRQPQLFMKAGDRCEIEIEGIGTLSNVVADES